MATVEKLDLLLKWFKDNEVEYDKESIEIRITEGSFGVYALKKLPSKKTSNNKDTYLCIYINT